MLIFSAILSANATIVSVGFTATGPGKMEDGKLISVSVKRGQKVMYKKWGGNEVKVGNEEWTMVEEKDILAILD